MEEIKENCIIKLKGFMLNSMNDRYMVIITKPPVIIYSTVSDLIGKPKSIEKWLKEDNFLEDSLAETQA